MNPEEIETMVIETTTSPTNIDDQSDEFQCEFVEDDPLADPLSSCTNETKNEFELPCSLAVNVPDHPDDTTKRDEEDQTFRLVDIHELSAVPVVVTPSHPQPRLEPEPSCSNIGTSIPKQRPPTPNYELEDLEDLIQSSRICTSKGHEPAPIPSTSAEILEIVDEVSQDLIEIRSPECDNSVHESCEKEIIMELEKAEEEEAIKTLEDDSMLLFEDFEDQITQNVLNKTDLHNTSIETENNQIEESIQNSGMSLPLEVEVVAVEDDKAVQVDPQETCKLLELDQASNDIKRDVETHEEAHASVMTDEIEKEPFIEIQVDVSPVEPHPQMSVPEVAVPTVEVTEPFPVVSDIVSDIVSENLCVIPSESININTRDVEDTLTVIVEAVDIIQHQSSSSTGIDTSQQANVEMTSEEPARDEEDGGLRSDGSDSGLGSEPSHNGSALLDKSSGQTTRLPDPPAKGNLKRRSSELIDECSAIGTKRNKKGIQFEGVTVYSFPRQQGFSCVPSQGGCTLGMANQHCGVKYYTLTEHTAEQRRNHRQQLSDMNPRSSSSDDSDSEYEPTDSSSEADSEVYGFLQPVSAKQRKALLKSAGVRKIDTNEKDDCKMIRTSREVCGCTCRVYCDPDTCACSLAGIKCQVDRPNFPCGCTRGGCGNVVGRVEFSPVRVRTHYIHTVMRLQMQNKQDRLRSSTNAASTASSNNYKAWQVQQQEQPQQSNIRQVPSSSVNGGSNCVDGGPMMEESQTQQHCDFSLIYDNHSSISSGVVTDIAPSANNVPASSGFTYQSETSSYANHIIDYVPKPSTSYANNTSNYDPTVAYMTSYADPQQQQQQQYLEVPYEAMQSSTYQIHSYDHHTYAMQPQMNFMQYSQYPSQSVPLSTPQTPYLYHNNGYVQSQLPPICEPLYQRGQGPDPIMSTTQHYDPSSTAMVPNTSSNNNCHTNIIPVTNKVMILENPNPINTQIQSQNAPLPSMMTVTTTNGNPNENLCEIIKKGIVETVSV